MSAPFTLNEIIFEDLISLLHHGETASGLPVLVWEYKSEFLSKPLIGQLAQLAERLVHLKHPNILGMIGFYADSKTFYTYHEKPAILTPLETVLETQSENLSLLWSVVSQVSKAMQVLESEGLAWGGINDNHVMLDGNQQVRLTKIVLPLLIFQDQLNRLPVVDHGPFLPPEFVMERRFDTRSDIFAFGVLVFKLFTKQWPYGFKNNLAQLQKGFTKPMKPFRKINPKIPDRIEKLAGFALTISPKNRFDSFSKMMAQYESDSWSELPQTQEKIMKKFGFMARETRMKAVNEFWVKWKKTILILSCGVLLVFSISPIFNFILSTATSEKATVPKVVGLTVKEAIEILESNKLRYVIAGEKVDPKFPPGTVIETKPPEGREVKDNREVRLYISKGDGQSIVPNLVGKTYSESAQLVPKTMVLNISEEKYSYTIPKGVILSQSPSPNMLTSSPVELVVSGGFPVTISTEAQSNGELTINIYTAVLREGPSQSIQILEQMGSVTKTLYEKTLDPGEQETHSFQVKQHCTITVLYNGKLAYKEQLD